MTHHFSTGWSDGRRAWGAFCLACGSFWPVGAHYKLPPCEAVA